MAVYSKEVVFALIESCITGFGNGQERSVEEYIAEKCGHAVILYLHRTARNLKNVA